MKIVFLGHRPQDMGGFEGNSLQSGIKTAIDQTIRSIDKPILLTSITLGVEMWAAEIAEAAKVPYHVYIPFNNYHARWPFKVRKLYSELLKNAAKRITIADGDYEAKKLAAKDLKLIEDADVIYSCFKEEPAIIKKAIKNGKTVINIFPKDDDDFFITF